MKITGGVITLNEEHNIVDCLRSLSFCDERIVVDSGSSDRTIELAQQEGAKILKRAWSGYADQRNYILDQSQHLWVLILDADERLPERTSELIAKLNFEGDPVAYRFPRQSYYLNRWIRHGGWYPDFQTRLLKRDKNRFVKNKVHERIQSDGICETLPQPIIHYPFQNLHHQVSANNHYSGLLAESLHESGKRFSRLQLLIRPWVKFFECYLQKRGFLDGLPGFFIAVSAAYSVFLKWSKLWERQVLAKNH